jgi:hypothetical protein
VGGFKEWVDGWAEEWLDGGMGLRMGLRVGFINVKDMYNNDVGKGECGFKGLRVGFININYMYNNHSYDANPQDANLTLVGEIYFP